MVATHSNVVRISKSFSAVVLVVLGCLSVSPSDAAITLTDDVIPSPAVGDPWDVGGSLSIGETQSGTMTVNAGSDVTNTDGYVANNAGSTGTVTVNGTGSTWTNSGELRMGNFGTGTLNITGGGAVSVSGNGRLGNVEGGTGTATVDGPGSTLTSDNFILVGRAGNGTLNIQNSGVVSDSIGGIAIFEGSTGMVTLSGSGSSWNNLNELQVADGGTATLNIINGAVASSPLGYLAVSTAGIGTVTVSGLGSAWNNLNQLQVGYGGTGTLNITDGGTVSDTFGYLGSLVGGNGIVSVNGAGSTWTNASEMSVGYEGTGTLNVTGGGTVSDVTGFIGNLAAGTGVVTVDGPGSTWANSGTLTVGNLGTGTLHIDHDGLVSAAVVDGTGGVNFDGGRLRINANAFVINALTLNAGGGTIDAATAATTATFNGNISGAGGLTKDGLGTLELIGTNNSYVGTTRLDAGMLSIGQAYLNDLADVYLAPGASFGLNFTGTDVINSLFIDSAAKPAGTYGAIGSGADFEMAIFTGTGRLRVTRLGLLGDYNSNGIVDAADYTVWRDNLGSGTALPNDDTAGVGQDDYDRWKTHFGEFNGSGASAVANAAVPEPASLVLLILAATFVTARRGRSPRRVSILIYA